MRPPMLQDLAGMIETQESCLATACCANASILRSLASARICRQADYCERCGNWRQVTAHTDGRKATLQLLSFGFRPPRLDEYQGFRFPITMLGYYENNVGSMPLSPLLPNTAPNQLRLASSIRQSSTPIHGVARPRVLHQLDVPLWCDTVRERYCG